MQRKPSCRHIPALHTYIHAWRPPAIQSRHPFGIVFHGVAARALAYFYFLSFRDLWSCRVLSVDDLRRCISRSSGGCMRADVGVARTVSVLFTWQ
ncbi:hypothetical protein HETIRDRAFT_418419 [Heterobasidion irregulare TC 32-1]|uniref:Uncharacterized protein n=1 Tax=Heterobasidion irregulare (strain TC 32-1) TaxID=747525 RepID=W4K3L8_HETIT|nr:uncharacterized protein HETIRDRAFT_418419 [Heterobasidion irregulare TC 32-1]ETW80402.1 hypothetical protein HETIRDRAFT_418419 [Heterobasidion irregulare TC 32-1]